VCGGKGFCVHVDFETGVKTLLLVHVSLHSLFSLHFPLPHGWGEGAGFLEGVAWLPISLKNAAKCDKWYQLQNLSITESLNAKGAREKLFKGDPRACRIAQCRT
jgi:hypothetical protein